MSDADKYVCTRTTCTFYGDLRTGTCNYRQMTGVGRGCPMEQCDKFTAEPYERLTAQNVSVWSGAPNHKKKMKEKEMGMKPKHDWEAIMTEYDSGASPKELGEKYGFNQSTLYGWLRQREAEKGIPWRRERAKRINNVKHKSPELTFADITKPIIEDVKNTLGIQSPGGRSFYDPETKTAHMSTEAQERAACAPDPVPEQSPAAAEITAPCANVGAERASKDPRTGISNFRWYSEDLRYIANILETLDEKHSLQRYRDCSKFLQTIVADMCEKRIRDVGALDRFKKERGTEPCTLPMS